jgi:hypothetical protein
MENLIEELKKYENKLPAHFVFWKVRNKTQGAKRISIFTESKSYNTTELLPIGYNKYISRNFNF